MGLFKRIGNAIKSGAQKVIHGAGRVVEKFGEITHIGAIEDAGFNMRFFEFKSKDRYDSISTASIIDYNRECENVVNEAMSQSAPWESKIIDEFKNKIDAMEEELNDALPTEEIRKIDSLDTKGFEDEIKNVIKDYVSDRISLNNEEFEKIIKIAGRESRQEKIKNYIEKTLNGASEKAKAKCLEKQYAIFSDMYNALEEYFSIQRNFLDEHKENLKQIEMHKNDSEYKRKEAIRIVSDIANMSCIRTLTYVPKG